MLIRVVLAAVFLLASQGTSGIPMPQPQDVDAESLAKTAEDAERYGNNQGPVDTGVVSEIFNTNNPKQNHENNQPNDVVSDNQFDQCTFYEQWGYHCVPYYQCDNGSIITDGAGLLDIRNGLLDPKNSKCESYLEVCCRDEDADVPNIPVLSTTPEPHTPSTPDHNQPIIEPITTTRRPEPHTTSPPPPRTPVAYQPKCGRRNTNGTFVRIVSDDYTSGATQFGEWPHMCAVLRTATVGEDEVNLYVSGGSLIAPNTIVTAAHYLEPLQDAVRSLKVRCGEWDTQQQIEPKEHVDRRAIHVTIHPEFNPKNLHNDVAIIHLEQPFELTNHIDTMCLPGQYEAEPYDTHNCVATGWGKDKFGQDGNYQVVLGQVEMDVVPHKECQKRLRKTRLGKFYKLHESMLCAGGEPGKDTCKGDGGGPLVCPVYGSDGRVANYVQAGIVAWGIGCGTEVPGLYADLSKATCFVDWATRCHNGQGANYYDYYGCARWAKRQYCEYKRKISDYDSQLQSDRIENFKKGKIGRARNKLVKQLPKYEVAVQNCASGAKDLDCDYNDYLFDSDDVDISGHAKAGLAETPAKKNKVTKDDDKDTKEETNHDADKDDDDDDDDPRSGLE